MWICRFRGLVWYGYGYGMGMGMGMGWVGYGDGCGRGWEEQRYELQRSTDVA